MRAPLRVVVALVASMLGSPVLATAQDALWLAPAPTPLRAALALELGSRGLSLDTGRAPQGPTADVRARSAQIELGLRGAIVALWIEERVDGRVLRAISSAAPSAREARLPDDDVRVILAIVGSLIDELRAGDTLALAQTHAPRADDAGRQLDTPPRGEAAPTPAPEPEPLSAYLALRDDWLVVRHDPGLEIPMRDVEFGVAIDRSFRVGILALGPTPRARRDSALGSVSGTSGGGGGVSLSLRGAFAGTGELRVGAHAAAVAFAQQNPLHHDFPLTQPSTFARPGILAGVRAEIGPRLAPSFALLVSLALRVLAYEGFDPIGLATLGLSSEWF